MMNAASLVLHLREELGLLACSTATCSTKPPVARSFRISSAFTVFSSTVTLVLSSLTSVPPSEARMVLKPTT